MNRPASELTLTNDQTAVPVTVAYGDGIGPEIMEASLRILKAAGARIAPEVITIGEAVYKKGISAGIEESAWDSLLRTKVFYKAPITTPQGGGFKSLNVTVRKTLGLFANVRPCVSYAPLVASKAPGMDLVIVRENEEDLYAGIEHRQTDEAYQCIKLITLPGTEKIIRYAFEYARANGRRKVTCMTKDNIMKLADGLFHKTFDRIGAEYPEIQKEHMIIDIGAAKIAVAPERFDVIVSLNLYGDIISDIAAEVAGSVGLAGSSNIGAHGAMFEAVHGSAPDIAGKGIANPSGLLQAGVLMLRHIGQADIAEKIENAWLKTLEDGIHTGDIFNEKISKRKVGTQEFADAVIERLGQMPTQFKAAAKGGQAAKAVEVPVYRRGAAAKKTMAGTDIFVHFREGDAEQLAAKVQKVAPPAGLKLTLITNRGVKVWPQGRKETFCADHWRCRFEFDAPQGDPVAASSLALRFASELAASGVPVIKIEHLFQFDGELGYSLGQGQ